MFRSGEKKEEDNIFGNHPSVKAHSSVDKGIMLSGVKMRKLPTHRVISGGNFELRAETLEKAIKVEHIYII